MKNLLILYNPYYQEDVIEQHLKVLLDTGKVAFGKVRSKLKNIEHSFQDNLDEIYRNVDKNNYLQLFLTDYSSIYVAKVTKITNENLYDLAPNYYKEKNLEVETWFLIEDICEIIRNDFKRTRDEVLVNFRAKNFNNNTYAVYGNNYIYPLIVNQKEDKKYFENFIDEDFKYYIDIFKSEKYLTIKQNLMDYCFSPKYIFSIHPESLNNIISAEIEYQENIDDATYDFTSVVIKYSKTMEKEIYLFMKELFKVLIKNSKDVENIEYTVTGINYKMSDILVHKPNLGTYKFLIKSNVVENAIKESFENNSIFFFIKKTLPYYINFLQDIRNEVVHGSIASKDEANTLRNKILGVADDSILTDILKYKKKILESRT
ncbi:HP0729 family protein [Aliarcobacter skirrowii]|uniref:HP0729 family protein n=1 Tax=Aliarcobacter skirrowii TaxID=28200 RepID=UPI0029B5EEC0|nr:HP0729 family protein [Aliarcobacter skirrowii]MDX3960195.1 HP0729 family protein [Aliarcobacter skirrowii]